jgi:hypothetical protein
MSMQQPDDPRRRFLIQALAAGLYTVGFTPAARAEGGLLGRVPEKIRPGQSFYRIDGAVQINGVPANERTQVSANDTIETDADSQAVFVVGQDAFLLRQNSRLQLSGKQKFKQRLKKVKAAYTAPDAPLPGPQGGASEGLVDSFRLVTGGVLTVFGKYEHEAATSTATVGIRGTGVYFESEADRSYVCTCYGTTEISSADDPSSRTLVYSRHHDAPKYIYKEGSAGQRIQVAPFKNHNDLELMLLEELVGRTAPFSVASDNYGAPRRTY